jgi:putative transposase
VTTFEDDASRYVVSYGTFQHATAENSVKVLQSGVENYGIPKQVMSDHGPQFSSIERESCPDPEPNEFEKALEDLDIKHIQARVKHPQSNGKEEKCFDTLMKLKRHFGSWSRAVEYYNFERPHMSLNFDECETPFQAYIRKMRPNSRAKFVKEHIELVSKWAPNYLEIEEKTKK